jgi:hypothetical protein
MLRKNEKFMNLAKEDIEKDHHVIKIVKDFARSEKEEDKVV